MEFEFYTAGRIVFGSGSIRQLGPVATALGRRALLVVGGRSAEQSGLLRRLQRSLEVAAVARCEREPQIEDVDRAVAAARHGRCDLVVAAGGGAVLDCGKAAAAMLTNPGSLLDYLEGVGAGRQIEREPAPMIAVPTTAGTGSEVTKNAVISGPGYKKSVRSALMIPPVALVDPELTHGTPPAVTAACGMDALTQLIEAYLSLRASPLTDALALQGIAAAGASLRRAHSQPGDGRAREQMALASLLGGICLANAGLGAVHGFASPIGALFPAAHGAVCACLLLPVLRANLAASRERPEEARVRSRIAAVGRALSHRHLDTEQLAIDACLEQVAALHEALEIPRLTALGLGHADLPRVVAGARGSSMRTNPIELSDAQLTEILESAL